MNSNTSDITEGVMAPEALQTTPDVTMLQNEDNLKVEDTPAEDTPVEDARAENTPEELLEAYMELLASEKQYLELHLIQHAWLLFVRKNDRRIIPVPTGASIDQLTSYQISSLRVTLDHDIEEAKHLLDMRKTTNSFNRILNSGVVLLQTIKERVELSNWESLDNDLVQYREFLRSLPSRMSRWMRETGS